MILGIDNYQVYLNQNVIKEKGLETDEVKKTILGLLNKDKRVLYAVDLEEVAEAAIPEPIKTRIINGYNWQRSGDIQIITHDSMLQLMLKKELLTVFGIHTMLTFH